MEITLLIDTSGSMAIGADAAGQALLKSKLGCAFACRDNVAVQGYGDAYLYAKAKGITLRYDAVNAGIVRLVDEFDSARPRRHQHSRIHSFLRHELRTSSRR